MPSTYVTGMGRISMAYQVDGKVHKMRVYCRNPQSSGATYHINSRALDNNDIDWQDAADQLAGLMDFEAAVGTTYGLATLERWSGTIWVPLQQYQPASNVTGSAYEKAVQLTLTLRDTALKLTRIIFLECIENSLQHNTSPVAGGASMDGFIDPFLPSPASANDPYNWAVSHRDLYLSTAPFVAFTVSYNKHLRRARGLV